MVITFIDGQGHLERIYLNDSAADELLGPDGGGIMDAVSSRGVDPSALASTIPKMRSDRDACRRLCLENAWDLFSLHPLQLSVQLLAHCNARCDFCYAGAAGSQRRRFMDIGMAKALKDYAADNGVKLGMTGGEPLLHPGIMNILSYRQEEVCDTLITNLTPDIDLSALAGTGVDLVQVSLHGKGHLHDQILGLPGAFDKAMERMAPLAESVNVATNTVVTPGNMGTVPELVRHLAEFQTHHGVRFAYVRFAPVVPSGTGRDRYGAAEPFFSEARSLLERIEAEWGSELELELPLLHPNPYEYRDLGDRTTCPAGATVAVVRLDGRICPCNQFVDTHSATEVSFPDTELHSIWVQDPLLGSMRRARKKPAHGVFCGGCAYLDSMQAH